MSSGLGGDSKTSVIVCAAQEKREASETTSAMLFGQACRKIEKTAKSGVSMLMALVRKLDVRIKAIEAAIEEKERWEVVEEVRKDVRVEDGTMESMGFGGMEVKKSTKLVGAESERVELGRLLRERAELTGTTLESEIGGSKFGGGVGFGQASEYGMGGSVGGGEVYRFKDSVDQDEVPEVLRRRGKVAGWRGDGGGEGDQKKLEKLAKKGNRAKFAYSGISA